MNPFLLIYLKHVARNKSREIPMGLAGLGKLGSYLSTAIGENIAFLFAFIFFQTVAIGWAIEKEAFSVWHGINPFFIVVAQFLAFIFYDTYSETAQTKLNKRCLSIYPISFWQKYTSFYCAELVGLKSLTFLALAIVLAVHNYFTPFINWLQVLHLYLFIGSIYLMYNTIIMLLKLLWTSKDKTKGLFIQYLLNGLVIAIAYLSWQSNNTTVLFSQNSYAAIITLLTGSVALNYLGFLLFKKITTENSFTAS